MDKILIGILAGEILIIIGLVIALIMAVKKGGSAPAAAPTPHPQPTNTTQMILLQGLAKYSSRFTGLYEALYMSQGTGQVPDAYHEWLVRVMKLQVDPQFYQVFVARYPENGSPAHVQDLIKHVQAAGVVRETATTHVANADTLKAYIYLGGDALCPGQTYSVVKPCWTCNGTVVEQGVLMPGR